MTNNQGAAAPITDQTLDQVAGGGQGPGKVSMNDVKGDPSQWGLSSFSWGATNSLAKKGSFDITE